MSLIDDIVGKRELQTLFVPEWDKDIYYYPFCLADADWATKMSKGHDGAFVAYTIIRKILNSDGEKEFTIKDKPSLMGGIDPDVLSRIVIEMKGDNDDEDEEGKKDDSPG